MKGMDKNRSVRGFTPNIELLLKEVEDFMGLLMNYSDKFLKALCISLAFLYSISQAPAAESDWITLISGTDGLENFNVAGDADWIAKDNSVQATSGNGPSWLVSKDNYADFVLRVEFWASDDANSGIYVRCADGERITDRTCYEANIFDQRGDPSFGTGAIVHVAPVDAPRPKVGGTWNVFVITMDGDHLIVELNNKRTVDVRDELLDSGPIGLQWGRGKIRFRKVEIREL